MADLILRIVPGFIPVLAFVVALRLLDNYKLVRFSTVCKILLVGALVAGACLVINRWALNNLKVSLPTYARYGAPVLEELGKAGYLVFLFKKKRVGFMVDAAILGFALGTGFALVENLFFLFHFSNSRPLLWVIRGFGTAIMHGGNVALIGILAKSLEDRRGRQRLSYFLPGLALAVVIHSLFNHLLLYLQLLASLIFLIGLPMLVVFIFGQSEKLLKMWLDVGFSSDVELLEMIRTGTVLQSKLGRYLQSLQDRMPGPILADMLCYLRIFVELSIKAKGNLLLIEAGFPVVTDPEVNDKFRELKYLEKSIGTIGRRILAPFLHIKTRELWQLHLLEGQGLTRTGKPRF